MHAIEIMTTIAVTSAADSGAGSLRAAISQAQAGDTIQFDSSLANKMITLTTGSLEVDEHLTIDGENAPGLTISGNNQYRVIDVVNDSDFTLKNLIIANGKTQNVGKDGAGAGLRTASRSTLTVVNSVFENNHANGEGGGAIFAGFRGISTIVNSKFTGNSTSANNQSGKSERGGGAISVGGSGVLTVIDSEFNNNTGRNGGAINILWTNLKVENSTFTENSSIDAGGAIFTDGASEKINDEVPIGGKIEILNSRFEKNKGVGQGGSLFLYVYGSDEVIVENSTIINNQVVENAKGDSLGGGLRHGNGKLTIRHTTFAYNQSDSQGGALWIGEVSPVTIDNSIFYGNRAEKTDGQGGLGGAITFGNGSNPTNITNTTVANNYAGFMGGAFWGGGDNVTLKNTLAADNLANNGGKDWNINHHTGTVFSDGGGNFQSNDPNPEDRKITENAVLLDPDLEPFTDNEGAVQTAPRARHPEVTGGSVLSVSRSTFPNAPSDLMVTAISATQTELTWTDNSDDETGFKIERSRDQQNWTVVATTAADATRYRDTDLTSNTPYYYRLRAINDIGDSSAISAQVTTDSITPPVPSPSLIQEPALSRTSEDVFLVEGDSDEVQLQFDLTATDTDSVNEIGIFWVDDQSGSINGIAPGEVGYLEAALNQSQVIFSVLPGNPFPDLSVTRQFGVNGGQEFGFYLVTNSTTDTVRAELAAGGTPDNVLFGLTSANGDQFDPVQVSELGDNHYNLAWEDGEDGDFKDLVFTVQLTQTQPVVGTQLQGGQEGEIIDLRDQVTGMIPAVFGVNSDADYDNSFGFYVIDDLDGRIGDLLPGDPGYAEAAVSQRLDTEAGLPAGMLVAPFIIADGTAEEFLAENPHNQSGQEVMAYFTFMVANPDGKDHVRLLGDNTFGFEDQWAGGDNDFNDMVVEVNFV
ncbi:Fibronectin type III domain protein [Coleofasciculus chthonoplastes PCC 7420]|uniref:Fibronectin type III domain protein n=2 Tax=Coleofasciculus chthonoplastes TaxID=64178 RepID=B4VTH8_9CYAN|nr:Fibronectin type III domain protein [Coleofasciculus chthonoplastes PCC 7420]